MSSEEQQSQFRERLANVKDFEEAFELVKSAFLQKLRMHSEGPILLLQMMPSNLGAYHMLISNPVVMNSYLLVAIKIAGSTEESNWYMFRR